jgi:bifunctional enzyme CysN/CysC
MGATTLGAPPLRASGGLGILRFITCGSVDDGKSTLIGRLLYDSGLLPEDHVRALEAASRLIGDGTMLDFSLLLDGLRAEREQGITIDVAYRYFATPRRRFIVADTPGHEQYTRNMATGASTTDTAVILIDARKGVITQTRRHSYIASLFGIRHALVAVNKMDLVGFSESVLEEIQREYLSLAETLGFESVTCVPLSALHGDNVAGRSARTPWYSGPTMIEYLETLDVSSAAADAPFRFPVQLITRAGGDFRGYAGTVASGVVRPGDPVVVLPSGRTSRVARVVAFEDDLAEASAGQAVTLTLADQTDVGRGDVICSVDVPAQVTDQFRCHLLWMSEEPMLPGRPYEIKVGCRSTTASVSDLRYTINVDTHERMAARELQLNEIGVCNIALDRAIAFDPYAENRDTGSFILIDRYTCRTVGAGVIEYGLRRATNIHWHETQVDKAAHARLKRQRPCVLWFTGLSGAGKSTIADLVEKRLHALGHHTYLLDGDNVRHGLNRDLGFTDADRVENIRRVAEVAGLFVDAGLIVLVSFISPFQSERRLARERMEPGEFFEVFVDAPLDVCELRDPKGLYRKAREGRISNFTGIDSPYEPPTDPDLHLPSAEMTSEEAADRVVEFLRQRGIV